NLLLARATSREKEMAIRLAMGASQVRLVRQLLTESLVLALLGGAAGTLFAGWSSDLLFWFVPNSYLPILFNLRLDAHTLLFTLLLTLATGFIFGLAPALQTARPELNETLKEGARGASAGSGRQRLRSLLVVSEIALALALLIGAGLCFESFQRAHQVDPGFDP